MTKKTLFLIAVALQVALLGWMVAKSERLLARGERVVLRVRPVDPIDFMTGRYIAAHPAVGRIDVAKVPLVGETERDAAAAAASAAPGDLARLLNRDVFVELKEEGEFWVAQRVVVAGGPVEPRAPCLRGRVQPSYGTELDVDYGLDRFDIPYDAEDPSSLARSNDHTVALVVRVASDGRSVTEDLVVDGRPFAEWNAAEKAKRK